MLVFLLHVHIEIHLFQSYPVTTSVSLSSINGDGAAEPVPNNRNEGEEENEAEEFSSSWPTTFTSSDTEESDAPKQVQHLRLFKILLLVSDEAARPGIE